MEKVLYTKSSDYRNKQTNLKTSIVDVDGKRYAKKDYVYPEGKAHLDTIETNQNKLKAIFEPEYKICPSFNKNESVYFDFIEGQSLEDLISDLYKKNNIDGIKKLIDEYHTLVWKMKSDSSKDNLSAGEGKSPGEKKTMNGDSKFEDVFGQQDFPEETEFGSFVDVDLIFANIIKQDKYCIIDYEWCFDFKIPLKYVFWKGLFTSNTISMLEDEIKEDICNRYALDKKTREQYLNMEENFVKYSEQGTVPFAEEAKNIQTVKFDINKAAGTDKSYPIVIFVKKSGEIVEEIHNGVSRPGGNQVSFLVDKEYDTLEVFFAPDQSIITDLSVYALDNNQERKIDFATTSESFEDAPEFFLRHTPVLIIKDCNYRRYRLEFFVSVWHEKKLAKEELDRYLNGIHYISKDSDKIISEKNREILSLGDKLNEKNRIVDSIQQRNVFKAQKEFFKLRIEEKNKKDSP